MKKKLLISAVTLSLLGGGALGSGYVLEFCASHIIRQNGFPDASVAGAFVTPTGFMLDHVALDKNDFSTVDNINITLDWMDFLKDRTVKSITIKDISLTCELDEDNHFKIAGWDATIPQTSEKSALLPIQSVLLQGVTLDIATPQGDIRIEGKLSVDTSGEGEQSLQYALWGQQHQISFDAKGTGKLKNNGDISLSTTLNDARINLPGIEASRASGWIDYTRSHTQATPTYSGQLIAGKINTMGTLLQNVTVTLDTSKQEALFFKTSPAGYKTISFTGRWITAPQNYLEANITSEQTYDLLSLLNPEKAKEWEKWTKNSNPLTLSLSAPISNILQKEKSVNYILSLGNNSSIATLNSSGAASYHPDDQVFTFRIDKTLIGLAKGKIDITPFTITSNYTGTPPLHASLNFKNMDMGILSELADIEGLKATGSFSGTIPVTYSDKGLMFDDGSIGSDKEGIFTYTPQQFPPSLQGDDARMQTVRDALSNFHFTSLNIAVSGPLSGKMKTTLKAEGTNPVFGDRPINLNLNLDGDLGAVIEQTLQAGDIGGKIRSKLTGVAGQ